MHQAEVSVWKDGRCQLVPLQDVVGACKIVEKVQKKKDEFFWIIILFFFLNFLFPKALNERDFETAFKLRGPTFKLAMDLFETFRSIDSLVPAVKVLFFNFNLPVKNEILVNDHIYYGVITKDQNYRKKERELEFFTWEVLPQE